MKLLIIAIKDNVNESLLTEALKQFSRNIGGSSDAVILTDKDLQVDEKSKSEFEQIIESIIEICGSPQYRTKFDMNFWTKFMPHFKSPEEAKIILNKIVDEIKRNKEARDFVRHNNYERIIDLANLALGMVR